MKTYLLLFFLLLSQLSYAQNADTVMMIVKEVELNALKKKVDSLETYINKKKTFFDKTESIIDYQNSIITFLNNFGIIILTIVTIAIPAFTWFLGIKPAKDEVIKLQNYRKEMESIIENKVSEIFEDNIFSRIDNLIEVIKNKKSSNSEINYSLDSLEILFYQVKPKVEHYQQFYEILKERTTSGFIVHKLNQFIMMEENTFAHRFYSDKMKDDRINFFDSAVKYFSRFQVDEVQRILLWIIKSDNSNGDKFNKFWKGINIIKEYNSEREQQKYIIHILNDKKMIDLLFEDSSIDKVDKNFLHRISNFLTLFEKEINKSYFIEKFKKHLNV